MLQLVANVLLGCSELMLGCSHVTKPMTSIRYTQLKYCDTNTEFIPFIPN